MNKKIVWNQNWKAETRLSPSEKGIWKMTNLHRWKEKTLHCHVKCGIFGMTNIMIRMVQCTFPLTHGNMEQRQQEHKKKKKPCCFKVVIGQKSFWSFCRSWLLKILMERKWWGIVRLKHKRILNKNRGEKI